LREKHPNDMYAGFGLLNKSLLKVSDTVTEEKREFKPGRDYVANEFAKRIEVDLV